MYFKQFKKSLLSKVYGNVVETYSIFNHEIVINEDYELFVNGWKIDEEFKSLEEAKTYIRDTIKSELFGEELKKEIYENIDSTKIASIIKKYHNTEKITDTLIENYIELASSKLFTLDPVVLEMRRYNRLSNIIENKIDFKLKDKSIVALSEETIENINSIIGKHDDIIQYMRENKDNFYSVLKQLKG